jgi:hypothetical protein
LGLLSLSFLATGSAGFTTPHLPVSKTLVAIIEKGRFSKKETVLFSRTTYNFSVKTAIKHLK